MVDDMTYYADGSGSRFGWRTFLFILVYIPQRLVYLWYASCQSLGRQTCVKFFFFPLRD